MDRALAQLSPRTSTGDTLEGALRSAMRGDVRFDALTRTLYATDASIYEITPTGVVCPRTTEDVIRVVETCHRFGTSIVPRGAGTGLAGGAIGEGVALDVSRHMNQIGRLDFGAKTIDVQPGVVLDELNAHLAPHGLMFAPDVATSSRATVGGMIGNNSCGAHSIIYGRTVDHIDELTVVLASGHVTTFGANGNASPDDPAADLERGLAVIRDGCHDEIVKRFPKVLRSNGGYGLDRLGPPGTPADAVKILCGSEGTLGVVVGAKLRLIDVARHTGLVVLQFDTRLDAMGATPDALRHAPAAVELIDRLILDAARSNPAIAPKCDFLVGDPSALLIVEFHGESDQDVASRMDGFMRDQTIATHCTHATPVQELERQSGVWDFRKAGLGLMMSRPGSAQPLAFVEDSAVDPSRLRDYMEQFGRILEKEGVEAGYYAHASVGCIHVRPILNLKNGVDVQRMRRIADAVSDLALAFGGAMTGEHGDGIVRSCWLEKTYGSTIVAAFAEVKRLFDPDALFNPHKIVDPYPMTERLRFGADFTARPVKTHLDFSAHGGVAGLAEMCSGVGECRKRLVGTMCPSFMATNDEKHTTRARANALRVALSGRGLLDGLDDAHLAEVMELCIGCKACKTECPTRVDMARLKCEYLSHRNQAHGVDRRTRMIVDTPQRLALASRMPRLMNLLLRSKASRFLAERRYGLDRRMPPPRLARRTFRAWFRHHRRNTNGPRGRVVYFVDTWTNYFTPQVGIAAVALLERAGFDVLCPVTACCGRPAISQGLLTEATQLARQNVRRLAPLAAADVPVVGTEPSCVLTLTDEYPQLVRSQAAVRLASQTVLVETLLRRTLDDDPDALPWMSGGQPALLHAHCHQKALVGTDDSMALLQRASSGTSREINSGCCGMAGAFGHEVEHYDIARAIGEQRLFPAVRDRQAAEVLVTGFSCRHQVEHHTDATPRHLVEYLADAIKAL